MIDKSSYELVKKTKEARKTTIEIILLVGLIGLLLGVFSNTVFSILWEFQLPNLCQIIIMVVLLALILILFWSVLNILYFQHIGEERQIKIILPFLLTMDHILVRELKSYDVTRIANEITKKVFRHDKYKHERQKIKEEFDRNSNPFQQGGIREIIMSLVHYLCIYYLGRAGEDSLGFSAPYHDGGYFPHLNPGKKKIEIDDSLKKNYFIEKDQGFKNKFLTPFCSSPRIFSSRNAIENGWSNIVLATKYGDIIFEISPYFYEASGKKTEKVSERRVIDEEQIGKDQTFNWLVEIDIKMKARLKGRWVFKKGFQELVDWIVYLFNYIERHMDWERYLDGETHRTLIDVDRKLNRALEKISSL